GYLPGHVEITNTMLAAWFTIIIGFLLILPPIARLQNVPGRWQGFIEVIVEAWYGLAKGVAGAKARQLLPIILAIFFFALIANLMKIIPGVDTIGELHCAGLVPGVEERDILREDYDSDEAYEEAKAEYTQEKRDAYIAFSGYERAELG